MKIRSFSLEEKRYRIACHDSHREPFKTYATPHGLFQALRGINLHIEQGEVFGIIGPSGAGKSTLVQCINLLERPNEGSIAIGGQPLTGLGEAQLRAQRRRIGMVFQGFNLLSRRTVYGNVALPLEIAGVPKSEIPARVERLLALVGLEHLRDRYPSQISGGQKQRVGIARALANDRTCCSATRPPRRWIPKPRTTSWPCCATSIARPA